MSFAADEEVLCALEIILSRNVRSNPALISHGGEADQLAKTAYLVSQFQSRPVRKRVQRPIELPALVWPLGEPRATFYWSDKRDPNDPEGDGRQGVWKMFRHGHDLGRGLRLYALRRPAQSRGPAGEPMSVTWPRAVGWLGDLTRIDLQTTSGIERINARKKNWGLWAMPDAQALFATPYQATGPLRGYVWAGGNLRVTWRGIEG